MPASQRATRLTAVGVAIALTAGLATAAVADEAPGHPPSPVRRAEAEGRPPTLEELVLQALWDLHEAVVSAAISRPGGATVPEATAALDQARARFQAVPAGTRNRVLPQQGVTPLEAVRRTADRLGELGRYLVALQRRGHDTLYTTTQIELAKGRLADELAAVADDEAVARGSVTGLRARGATGTELDAAERAAEQARQARLDAEALARRAQYQPREAAARILAEIDRLTAATERNLDAAADYDLTPGPSDPPHTPRRIGAFQLTSGNAAAGIDRLIGELEAVEGLPPAVREHLLERAEARRTVAASHQRQLDLVIARASGAPVQEALDQEALDQEALDQEALDQEALDQEALDPVLPDGAARTEGLANAGAILAEAAAQVGADRVESVGDSPSDEAALRVPADGAEAPPVNATFAELAREAAATPDPRVLDTLAEPISQQGKLRAAQGAGTPILPVAVLPTAVGPAEVVAPAPTTPEAGDGGTELAPTEPAAWSGAGKLSPAVTVGGLGLATGLEDRDASALGHDAEVTYWKQILGGE